MSIANAIREAVLFDECDTLMRDEVLNKVLSAFMQKGDWLATYTHAVTFALFVAEELDADQERRERTTQLLRMVEKARVYISDQRACLWRSHVHPRTGRLDPDADAAVHELDVLLIGLNVGARRLLEVA